MNLVPSFSLVPVSFPLAPKERVGENPGNEFECMDEAIPFVLRARILTVHKALAFRKMCLPPKCSKNYGPRIYGK